MQVEPKADLNELGAGLLTDEHKLSSHSLGIRVSGDIQTESRSPGRKRLPEKTHLEMRVPNRRKCRWTLDVEFIAGGKSDGKYLPPGNAIENTA